MGDYHVRFWERLGGSSLATRLQLTTNKYISMKKLLFTGLMLFLALIACNRNEESRKVADSQTTITKDNVEIKGLILK
jgi:hypothetical protein